MSTYDHEIKIDNETKRLRLVRGDNGEALYNVLEEVPDYQSQLRFIQVNWLGGHGQFNFAIPDLYFEGQSIDTTQDGRVFLGPYINQVGISGSSLGANPVCFCWFEAIGKWMVATATKIFWYDGTNFVEKVEFAGKVITGMTEFDGVLFVSLAGTDEYYYSTTGAAYTESGLTQDVIHGFFQAPNPAGTANILYGWVLPNKLYTNTSGINVNGVGAQWGSVAYMGDTTNDITNIFLVSDNLMIGKEDNLFHYDSDGGLHSLMPDLRHNKSSTNFKYVTDWQTGVYFSLVNGIGEITSYNSYAPMGPLQDIGDIGKAGSPIGVTSDTNWLYIGINEGTNKHIYKGREIQRAGGLRWEWCPWVYLGTNACATLKVCQHTATDRRLWFGYGNYAAYVILTDNPTATSSGATFAASGWLRMSYTMGSNRYWDKLWQSVITQTEGCASGITVTPKYRKDTETSASNLTGVITSNGTVKSNLINELNCKRIQFQVDLASNDTTKTPEVSYFEARGVENPETIRVHEATYSIGDKPSERATTIRNFLRSARTSTKLIKFADLRYGQSTNASDNVYVVMQAGYPQEVEILHTKDKLPELGIRCRWQEVNYG